MQDFSQVVLVSDIDGTLVDHTLDISPQNQAAIARLVDGGGYFTLCTGRSPGSTRQFAVQLPINLPCVCSNGGSVYDYRAGQTLYDTFLPGTGRGYFERIRETFPFIHGAVLMDDIYYQVTPESKEPPPFTRDRTEIRRVSIDSLAGPWHKILFQIPEAKMGEVREFCLGLGAEDVRFITSAPFYIEMLPQGVNKASGIGQMLKCAGIEGKTLVAVGDYYNDVEMITLADVGIAPANAPEDIQEIADLVVCPCQEGAISEAIAYIENHFG